MYKLFLTLRYLRKRRIAYFAIAAVMLCSAMVLIVMSVMGGFLDLLKAKARGLLGDIIIDNRSYSGFPLYDEFIADIATWPEIEKATPVLYSYGLLRFSETTQTQTVRVVGIRLADVYVVNAFKSGLYYETYYPGTTTLAPQAQPRVGFDAQQTIEVRDAQGTLVGTGRRPLLPPAYQAALERSWAAGLRDTLTPPTELTAILRGAGLPEIVGVYDLVDDLGPPCFTGNELPGLIIGRDIIAERLPNAAYKRFWAYPRGCVVALTLLPLSASGTADLPVKQPFRYVDDSRTGIYEIDSQHVYCDFELLQRLLQMHATERVDPETGRTIGTVPGRASQIQVKLRPAVDGRPVNPEAVAQRLSEHYRALAADPRFDLGFDDRMLIERVEALTWEQSQRHIIAPVENERRLVTILFGIISLVAVVLVLCILYMIVLQKTRDIGIVKSLGGSSTGVAAIFVTYGAAVGLVGALTGAALGVVFVRHINEIQDFLTWAFGWRVWSREVYSFDAIPSTVRVEDAVAVIVAAILAATLGSLLAAWRAGAMQPVEALRHE